MSEQVPATPRVPTLEDFPASGPNSLASFGERGAGWILDFLVALAPTVIVYVVVLADVDMADDAAVEEAWASLPSWLPATPVVLWVLLVVPLVAWRGQTLGQLVLGHRVARFADGRKPGWDQALIRALLPASLGVLPMLFVSDNPFVVLPGWTFPYLVALSSPMQRGLHDVAAGTVVVRTG